MPNPVTQAAAELFRAPRECGSCRFYSFGEDQYAPGVCRRFPPQLPLVRVSTGGWCGEFVLDDELREEERQDFERQWKANTGEP